MNDDVIEEYAVRFEELSNGSISRVRAEAILNRFLDESR